MEQRASSSGYPAKNLFFSPEWIERGRTLRLDESPYEIKSVRGLRIASLAAGKRSDLEPWPCFAGNPPPPGCDWVIHRKLLPETAPSTPVKGWVTDYSVAPWLDLTKPITVKTQVAAHIRRTERKIAREAGPLSLVRADDASKERWFAEFASFQSGTGRFDADHTAILKTWLLSGDLPPWVRLMSLRCQSEAGDEALACGIFYVWEKVFYYFAPVMNPAPEWRKYGPGKLFVQKLIDSAIAEGCEVFDFLQGAHEYKFHWNPEVRKLYQCIVPVTAKGKAALAALRLRNKVRGYLRSRAKPAQKFGDAE